MPEYLYSVKRAHAQPIATKLSLYLPLGDTSLIYVAHCLFTGAKITTFKPGNLGNKIYHTSRNLHTTIPDMYTLFESKFNIYSRPLIVRLPLTEGPNFLRGKKYLFSLCFLKRNMRTKPSISSCYPWFRVVELHPFPPRYLPILQSRFTTHWVFTFISYQH